MNWAYRAKMVGPVPGIVIQTGRNMNRLWNELVWLHDRTPYRLLRSVERMCRDLAADAQFRAGAMREQGDEKKALAFESHAAAHLAKANSLKGAAEEVKKQSYQGFDPAEFNEQRAEIKRLKEEAKAAKALGSVERAAELSAQADALHEQSREPLALRLELTRAIEDAKEADARGDAWAAAEARKRVDTICDDPRLGEVANFPLQERVNYHTQERGTDLGLPVWCKWHVGDNFKQGLDAYAKKIRFAPRVKKGLDSIHIEQRTESGAGWSVGALFAKRKPFSMRPETMNGGLYEGWEAPAWFTVSGERVPVVVVMHRPLPDGAVVKRYSLIGRYEPSSGEWKWRIKFQLEVPPNRKLYSMTNRAIAVDLGWRQTEAGIRIMMIDDGHQFVEIVLPYDLTNRIEKANLRSHPPVDIRQSYLIQAERDRLQEECKAEMRKLDTGGWPEEALKKLRGLKTMKRGGLIAVRDILVKAGVACQLLDEWLSRDIALWQDKRGIEERWHATRDEILRVLAVELAEQCDQVRWEGEFSAKAMAEQESRQTVRRKKAYSETGQWDVRSAEARRLEASQMNRRLANHSQFRVWLREAMTKRGRDIIDDDTAYSSQICSVCSGAVESSADLIVKCQNCGKLFDQDKNTVRYYWNRFDPETREVAAPLALVNRSLLKKVWRVLSS
jgi:hypothetical protein